jgi:enamine deaminase RidA (YjgF/YER057c/UK114 family)
MTTPQHVEFLTPKALPPLAGFSHVATVTDGQTIYVAGQVALDAARNIVGRGDLRAQAEQLFANIRAALPAADADCVCVAYGFSAHADLNAAEHIRRAAVNQPDAAALAG